MDHIVAVQPKAITASPALAETTHDW